MNIVELYLSGMTIKEVSLIDGRAVATIRYHLCKAGVLRSVSESIKLAAQKGRMGRSRFLFGRVVSKETRDKMSKSKTARAVGFRINTNGYYEYTMGDSKGRHVHVVLMEGIIGRKLYLNECVHHKDEDKLNNDASNLMLMTKSAHAQLHAKSRSISRSILGRYI